MNITTFILKNIKKCRYLFFANIFYLMLNFTLSQIIIYTDTRIIGCFEIKNHTQALHHALYIISALLVLYTLQAIVSYYQRYFRTMFLEVFKSNITIDLFTYTHKHSVQFFQEEMSGRLSGAIQNIGNSINILYHSLIFDFYRPISHIIISLFIISTFSFKLSFFMLLTFIPIFLIHKKITAKAFAIFYNSHSLFNKINGTLTDSISNYKLVKFGGSFYHEQITLFKYIKAHARSIISVRILHAKYFPFLSILSTLFATLGIIGTIYYIKHDEISLENAIYAISSLIWFRMALWNISSFTFNFADRYGSLKANLDLINKPIHIKDMPNAKPLKIRDKPEIKFQNIKFGYISQKRIFQNLNLTIKEGEKVGIVGYSGAGKSTLIKLLLRSYNLNGGNIQINDQNIKKVTLTSLHKNIAVVSQDTNLFNRSIKENLKIANPSASDKQIYTATKQAHIHNTIKQFPQGYESIVGEKGLMLSGGERQRISIARAILQNAPILILDEATSSLDSDSEVYIQKKLKSIMKNKTVIAIAHRLSTLKEMDRIITLEKGKIVENDTPKNLLKNKNGIFYKLYHQQMLENGSEVKL